MIKPPSPGREIRIESVPRAVAAANTAAKGRQLDLYPSDRRDRRDTPPIRRPGRAGRVPKSQRPPPLAAAGSFVGGTRDPQCRRPTTRVAWAHRRVEVRVESRDVMRPS